MDRRVVFEILGAAYGCGRGSITLDYMVGLVASFALANTVVVDWKFTNTENSVHNTNEEMLFIDIIT